MGIYGFAWPKPERADELERLLLSFVAPTRAEPGSMRYQVHRDAADPGTLVFTGCGGRPTTCARTSRVPNSRTSSSTAWTTCAKTWRSTG
ncbi:putative quinol monooxygenase [[Actinomadura] parvosata]|uniref:putative quinol monooxygenase n=1 Tax=[Actinomadura] parvosata TaxID=1955412 RepID=UPI00406BEC7A